MEELVLFEAEKKLMEIIWQEAPVESGRLVKIAKDRIHWTKSTTYTVLRKLIAKGFVRNEDAVVSVLIPKEQVLISLRKTWKAASDGRLIPQSIRNVRHGKHRDPYHAACKVPSQEQIQEIHHDPLGFRGHKAACARRI